MLSDWRTFQISFADGRRINETETDMYLGSIIIISNNIPDVYFRHIFP